MKLDCRCFYILFSILIAVTALKTEVVSTFKSIKDNAKIKNYNSLLYRDITPQPTYGLINNLKGKLAYNNIDKTKVIDVVSVLGRFTSREEFYPGEGYIRPSTGLLTKQKFYEQMTLKQFNKWPRNELNELFGCENLSDVEINSIYNELKTLSVSRLGCDAIFASFSKGAENGVVYPQQVDEEMKKWLNDKNQFDIKQFELSLLLGKINVAIGWFLYIGLQYVGIYVIFIVPILQQFYPNFDYYFVRTYLHVHFGLG